MNRLVVWLFCAGKVGELTMALSDLIWEEMESGGEPQRVQVPYV